MSENYYEKNKDFIKQIAKLNAGDLAVLRRNVDNPQTNIKALPILARFGAVDSFARSLTACLYSVYHRENDDPFFKDDFNFGRAYYYAIKSESKEFKPEEHDKRFKIIIASDKDDLSFRLRQAVKQIRSKDQPIDFSILLRDLYNWDNENRWIQREWVKGFYNINEEEENNTINNEGEDL
jgi:CRISPR type I-E-associated protein CasB/Cse2